VNTETKSELDEKQFVVNMEELLEVDPGSLHSGTELASLTLWDSLAFMSFLAMADSMYGVKVAPVELRKCKTVRDLTELVSK
jgi:acyl carrier protein